jgi:phosphatidate phosphatase APP1
MMFTKRLQFFYICISAATIFPSVHSFAIDKISNYFTGQIAADEQVQFFPTIANRINSTHWLIPIHGWIYEPEYDSKKRKLAIKGMGKLFRVEDATEKMYLNKRIMPFVSDNQSMKFVKIHLNGDEVVHKIKRSAKDGHFIHHLEIHEDHLHPSNGVVSYQAVDEDRIFQGLVHLNQDEGVSIISDIDDTVKITNYLDKKEFYKNTFLREFKAVEGMQQLLQKCKSQYQNCSIHYVSASPYQLFEALSSFFREEGFPEATFHLKRIRIKDRSLLKFFEDPFEYKLQQIEPILKTFPRRKFILIGDSGEKDPEIYKELIRKYPDQIERIWIRNVNESGQERMEGVDKGKWRYFNDGFDLMKELE